MAQALMDASRPAAGGQSNPFFDTGARDLVARFLLAAARSGRSLAAVKQWVNDPGDDEAVALLRQAGEHEKADELQATLNMVEVTRSGIFAGAQQIMEFTADERTMSWVTPNGWISELRPEDLVSGADTLYLLSQEGPVSAAPVVTALTMALTEAAMEHAKRQPGGRLSIPGLVMLDEAANVCRWGQLPSLYSHFGSRGILVDTILQSWSQGVTAWGREGMQTLWSASNVKVYGGSVAEPEFLSMISDLIGSHWVDQVQTTSSRGGSSSTRSLEAQERKIAPIDQLGSLPKGRAWVLASGSTALLSRLVPFWEETMRTTSKAKCTMSDDVLAEASQEIAKAWRAGMQIAEFMAIRRQRELARAQRNSTEDERRLRQVIEGERRLAAPVYRAALDKGWWETASAEQAAHTHCVAVRFSRLDPQAEQAVIECERQARLKWNIDLAQTRRPLKSQDVDSKALAATAPAVAGEEQENWGQHLDQSAHDRAHDAPSRKQPAAPASQGDAREAEKPSSRVARRRARAARACTDKEAAEARDALHASADASTPATRAEQADVSRARAAETAWDSQAACEEWAQQQIEAGCPPDAVRAAVTGRLALHEPASQATRAPAAGAGSAGGGAAASRATQAPTRANGRGQARAARQSALRTRQQRP
nr:TraM recognition domain-containing protein [uncultured Actinomyces sp.]